MIRIRPDAGFLRERPARHFQGGILNAQDFNPAGEDTRPKPLTGIGNEEKYPHIGKTVKPRLKKIRRIVTGHDARGRSVFRLRRAVASCDDASGYSDFRGDRNLERPIRCRPTTARPRTLARSQSQLAPPKRGTVVRVVEFPPDKLWIKSADRDQAFASMGSSGAQALAHDASASRHPMMHRTKTVDYAIVLSGEIWALMDSRRNEDEGRRYSRPARHQSCLVKPIEQTVPGGLRADRREAAEIDFSYTR